jgi:hypothetical protein
LKSAERLAAEEVAPRDVGRMTVLDAEGLLEGSCECLELMEREMDRIFDRPWRDLFRREDKKKD